LPSRGDTVAFWEDVIDGNLNSDTFPNLAGYAKILRLPSGSLEMKATSLIVSIFPCPELRTMNFFSCNSTLTHFLPLIHVRMTPGGSFGDIRSIPPVNIISINSKT
jgi:hypothetical protein